MNRPAPDRTRCAIYTRKSSEEGLDQAFNSLHAQREACEAYIKSQAHEGWRLTPGLYDDGGFSGGNLDRPALARLLADVDAGNIDVVVVYKVDRLTRALTDFARIVDRLDAVGASFVSVTQAFNTTSSMGRLTLNVLLSFAQFEREVTGERIRDKIAASKAKGMWLGGNLPLGYDRPTDLATRALVVNEIEAAQVRLIFERYLQLTSVSALEAWLHESAIRSKSYQSLRGRQIGGARFSRGALFHLLKNRIYLGEIPHKDTSYPGAHPAIIDSNTFEAAQAVMSANARRHGERPTRVATMALKGVIFDADAQPMSPAFAHGRGGRMYRYYVSTPQQRGVRRPADDAGIRRIPAQAIEALVLATMGRVCRPPLGSWPPVRSALRRVEVHADEVHLCLTPGSVIAAHGERERELEKLARRLAPGERAHFDARDPGLLRIVLPVRLKLRGGRCWLLAPDGRPAAGGDKPDATLVGALRSAHQLAKASGISGGGSLEDPRSCKAPVGAYYRRVCRLAFLAPDIQRAILAGRQPPALNLERLVHGEIPPAWVDQRLALGFAAAD